MEELSNGSSSSALRIAPLDHAPDKLSAVSNEDLQVAQPKSDVALEWRDLTVEVDVGAACRSKTRKRIVHGSRGVLRRGELVAVLGPTGAGKTTLFQALACRGRGLRVSGQQLLFGKPYVKDDLLAVSGFVFQHMLFREYVTVREALMTAAMLKLPKVVSAEERTRRVEALIDAFDLRRCANTRVGSSLVKGISGGELKRLSIASELLNDNKILFCDEPTTGQDAQAALSVMKILADVAESGVSVLCVLHQPRSSILAFVDKFLVLSDGRDVFFGTLNEMLMFFSNVGFVIPPRVNPSDIVLDLVNTNPQLYELLSGTGGKSADSFSALLRGGKKAVVHHRRAMKTSSKAYSMPNTGEVLGANRKDLAKHLSSVYRASDIASGHFKDISYDEDVEVPSLKKVRSGWCTRFGALLWRECLNRLRAPEVAMSQLLVVVVSGLVLGSVYYQLPAYEIFNRFSAIAFGILCSVFISFNQILRIPVDREVYLQEQDNKLYTPIEYYLAISIPGTVLEILCSFILSSIYYWMAGFRSAADAFFIYAGFNMLSAVTAGSMMQFVGSISPTPTLANSICTIFLVFVMVLNGFFVSLDSLPSIYYGLAIVNYMRLSVSACEWNEFHNTSVANCTAAQGCSVASGDALLESRGIPANLVLWNYALYILAIWLCFHILALFALTFCFSGKVYELAPIRFLMKKVDERRERNRLVVDEDKGDDRKK